MPHGKCTNSLWNYFPTELKCTEELWNSVFLAHFEWRVLPESFEFPAVALRPNKPLLPIPQIDAYLFTADDEGPILGTDHEGYGPWLLPPGVTLKSLPPQRALTQSISWPGRRLDAQELRRNRDWARRALVRSGCRLPPYRLAAGGIAKDNWWNYIPVEFDVEDAAIAKTFLSTSEVIAWSETPGSRGAILDAQTTLNGLAARPDSYYLDWPGRRWLIAVPDLYCRNPDDPDMLPSLVQFSR